MSLQVLCLRHFGGKVGASILGQCLAMGHSYIKRCEVCVVSGGVQQILHLAFDVVLDVHCTSQPKGPTCVDVWVARHIAPCALHTL